MSPNLGQELASLDFANLIGGPLNAIVDAQAKSAIATANFVREVGFDKNGDVRNTTFRYTRPNAKGVQEEFALTVPFLAMLPIPYVQIEEGEVEFNAKLTSQQETRDSSDLAGDASLDAEIGYWCIKAKVKASMSYKKSTSSTEKVERSFDMRVRVKVKGTDMPAGTERILSMLENSMKEKSTGMLPTEVPLKLVKEGTKGKQARLTLEGDAAPDIHQGDTLILGAGSGRTRVTVTALPTPPSTALSANQIEVEVLELPEDVEANTTVEWLQKKSTP